MSLIAALLLAPLSQAYDGDPGKVHACVGAGGQLRVVAAGGYGDPFNDCSGLPGFWVPIHLDEDWSGSGTGSMYNTHLDDLVGIGTPYPQHRLDVHGDVRGDGRIAFGSDAVIGYDGYYERFFELSQTVQDFSSAEGWTGLRSYLTLDPLIDLTRADVRYVYGTDLETRVAAGNDRDLRYVDGQYLGTFHDGTGHVDELLGALLINETNDGSVGLQVGAWAISDVRGAGSARENYALRARSGNRGSGGTITDNYGVYVETPEHAGGMVNNYGVYVANQEFGAGRSYALYTEAGDVHLGGPVGVGTPTPASALQVRGYTQLDLSSGRPPAADCDQAAERGRMKVDSAAGLLYVCVDSGWVGK